MPSGAYDFVKGKNETGLNLSRGPFRRFVPVSNPKFVGLPGFQNLRVRKGKGFHAGGPFAPGEENVLMSLSDAPFT